MPKLRRITLAHKPSIVSLHGSLSGYFVGLICQQDKIPLKLRGISRGFAGSPRNAGRKDGSRWNGKSFISPADVDGHPDTDKSEDDEDMTFILQMIDDLSARESIQNRRMSISLLDIARPAKAKGTSPH